MKAAIAAVGSFPGESLTLLSFPQHPSPTDVFVLIAHALKKKKKSNTAILI